MKCTIPEISFHNRDPVLSIDIQVKKNTDTFFRLASGGTDSHVVIWYLKIEKSGVPALECAADLTRHQKPVNVVRFSPSGDLLASGDDDACIIIWKQKTVLDAPEFPGENNEDFKEQWVVDKVLRGHLQDVYDLSWSADSKLLISGSIDNTAILWDISSGKNLGILTEHKGFVQGVSWDPCGQYVATMASDRFLRIFNPNTKKIISRVSKAKLPKSDPESKPTHLFHDDTIKTFFRRLTFSPDGELLIVPSGLIEQPGKNTSNSTLIFSRKCFNKPVVYLPSMNQYTVVARCCPTLFTLRPMTNDQPLFDLQYRIVIAVATQRSVLLYDTQHAAPIALITNIHYTRITDLTWSSDGKILVISSTDGYCSFITFTEGELGDLYDRTKEIKVINTKHNEKMDTSNKEDHKELKTVGENDCTKTDIDNTLSFQGKISPLKKNNDFKLPTYVAVPEIKEKAGTVNLETKMDVDDDFHLIYEDTTESKLAADETKKVDEEKIEDTKNEKETIAVPKKDSEENRFVEDNVNKGILVELSPVRGDKEESFVSPKCSENVTPGQSQKNKTPRRVQLITLSSPKSKKKLL